MVNLSQRKQQKYSLAKVVAVDVDGTLLIDGEINQKLAEWCNERKKEGFCLMLWSARGKDHADNICRKAGLDDTFDYVISKPAYIVDDKGWLWTKYTKVINPVNWL